MHPSKHNVLIAIALVLVIAIAIPKPALMHSFAQSAVPRASKVAVGTCIGTRAWRWGPLDFLRPDLANCKRSRIRLAKLVRI